jgi:hypothetical protein
MRGNTLQTPNGHSFDVSRLTYARQAAYELQRMQKAAAELPELERQQAEAERIQQAQQMHEKVSSDLETMVRATQNDIKRSDREVEEICAYFVDIVQRRQAIGEHIRNVIRMARTIAQARIELGQVPGGGSWGHSQFENEAMLNAITEAVLQEHNFNPSGNVDVSQLDDTGRALVELVSRFVDVSTTQRKPKPPRLFPVVNHRGETEMMP